MAPDRRFLSVMKLRSFQLRIHLLRVILLSVLRVISGSAQQYVRVAAEFESTIIQWKAPTDGGLMRSTNQRTLSFVCVVGTNDEWQLSGEFAVNGAETWMYDGTNVVCKSQVTKPLPDRFDPNGSAYGGLPLESVRSNVTINIYPTRDAYLPGSVLQNIPWLAFCSGGYLRHVGRVIPLPVALVDYTPDAFAYRDRTETFPDELGLPQIVELFTSSERLHESGSQFRRTQQKETTSTEQPVHAEGLLKFHYIVTESTNFLGWHLPLAFEYEEDLPDEYGGIFKVRRGRGKVSNLTACSQPTSVFDQGSNQTVVDHRFRDARKEVNGIIYRWSNTFVSPTNDKFLQSRFATTIKQAPYVAPIRRKRARVMVAVLLVIAAAVPTYAYFRNARTKPDHKRRHHENYT
jgi:hypothetical protein